MAFEPKRDEKEIKYAEARIYSDAELHNYTEEELKNFKIKHSTPMCDELESGPWPSFVADAKREALHRKKLGQEKLMIEKDVVDDLLGQLELSFVHGETHWKHGGIVGVFGYGGGVIGRYSDLQKEFPSVAHFHTMRVNQPASKFYNTDYLRTLCDLWEYRGSGMLNLHGSTGDIVLLGTFTEQLEPIFFELGHVMDQDLGGSGSNLRTPSCCIGKARCEFACIDTQELSYEMTQHYQDELHRPQFPYKYKFKFDGCPNCCVASIARSDTAFIGTWRDDDPDRPESGRRLHGRRDRSQRRRPFRKRLGQIRHSEGSDRPLPHPVYVDGWQEAHDRRQGTAPAACTASMSCPGHSGPGRTRA